MTSFSQNSSNLLLALATVRRCVTPVPAARIENKYGRSVLNLLLSMGLVRHSVSRPGCVVTVKHKRAIVDAMTNKVDSRRLDLSATAAVTPQPNVEFHQNKSAQTMALAYIYRAPSAVHQDAIQVMLNLKGIDANAITVIDNLKALGLVQAHRDNSKCVFTRKNKRAIIEVMTNKVKDDAFPVRRVVAAPVPSPVDLYNGTGNHLARR